MLLPPQDIPEQLHCAGRHGAFDDEDFVVAGAPSQIFGDLYYLREVGVSVFLGRGAHGNENDVAGLNRRGDVRGKIEPSFVQIVLQETLDPFFVEGLVHVSTLPEWVEFDEASDALVARDSGRRYGLGDRYRVLVEQVDPVKGWINFSISEPLASGPKLG